MPTTARERYDDALEWLENHATGIGGGFYLEADDGQPNPETVYCRHHGHRAATLLTQAREISTDAVQCFAGDDSVRRCGIVTCDRVVDTGGLTDYGIKDTLGLDDDYLASLEELLICGAAMHFQDPHIETWLARVAAHRELAPAEEMALAENISLIGPYLGERTDGVDAVDHIAYIAAGWRPTD